MFDKNTGLYTGYIYCIENTVNGKKYIGQTTRTIAKRWGRHLHNTREQENYALYRAMNKYGVDKFIKYEVENVSFESKDELLNKLNELEVFYIAKYNTYLGDGYNLTRGGAIVAESRLGAVLQWDIDGNFISEFECANYAGEVLGISMSHILDCCRGIYTTHGGFLWTFKGQTPTPITNQRSKHRRVCQFYGDGEFIKQWDSIKEAADNTSGDKSGITMCCKGQYIHSGGYIWRFLGDSFDKYEVPKSCSRVQKYSNNGILLCEFINSKEAAKDINVPTNLINKCCNGEQNTCKGFIYCYKNDIPNLEYIDPRLRRVSQFTYDGDLIASYPSILEAERLNNFSASTINECCNGNSMSSHGFVWRYVGDPFDKY